MLDHMWTGVAPRRAWCPRSVACAVLGCLLAAGRAQAQSSAAPAAAVTAAPQPAGAVYGSGLRGRWVSIPGWLLGAFTKKNMPVSSYGIGAELFRRNDNRDITLGLTYQNLSAPDGNWLGRGYEAAIDTDLVQFRSFGIVGLDVSSVWRVPVHRQVAFRYGAGLGLAVVTGKVLRVSAANCTEQNASDTSVCHPRYCPAQGPCPESLHVLHEPGVDNGPSDPHRYQDPHIPAVFPVVNLLAGFDFHIPDVKGLELRLEGGFYDAFFLGAGAVWIF